MTTQQRAHSCPFPHDIATKRPQLGVSLLAPSPNLRPLLHLLGATDQELQKEMARGHPYQFNLGHGRSFKDYKEAANALMERNMPDVVNDRQTTVVFIPDTLAQGAQGGRCDTWTAKRDPTCQGRSC